MEATLEGIVIVKKRGNCRRELPLAQQWARGHEKEGLLALFSVSRQIRRRWRLSTFADNYIPIYEKFGLNKTEIEIIAKATKRKEYYYKSTKGSRLFELDLKEKTLSLIASSDLAKQNKAKELKEVCNNADDFTREWLSYGKGI